MLKVYSQIIIYYEMMSDLPQQLVLLPPSGKKNSNIVTYFVIRTSLREFWPNLAATHKGLVYLYICLSSSYCSGCGSVWNMWCHVFPCTKQNAGWCKQTHNPTAVCAGRQVELCQHVLHCFFPLVSCFHVVSLSFFNDHFSPPLFVLTLYCTGWVGTIFYFLCMQCKRNDNQNCRLMKQCFWELTFCLSF